MKGCFGDRLFYMLDGNLIFVIFICRLPVFLSTQTHLQSLQNPYPLRRGASHNLEWVRWAVPQLKLYLCVYPGPLGRRLTTATSHVSHLNKVKQAL